MKLLSTDEVRVWSKRNGLRAGSLPAEAEHWRLLWPEEPQHGEALRQLAVGLSRVSGWNRGVLVVANSGMPRKAGLADVVAIRARSPGRPGPANSLWDAPGHEFDEDDETNQALVAAFLGAMMSGYVEGTLATNGARFVVKVGCGIIEIASRDKGLSGRLRALIGEQKIRTID